MFDTQKLPSSTNYSHELTRLIDDIVTYAADEDSVPVVTVEYFIERTIEYQKDSFLYKALSTTMSVYSMDKVVEKIASSDSSDYGVLRPGSYPKLSQNMIKYLEHADNERKKMSNKLITSDHILLSILSSKDKTIVKSAIYEEGGNYETLFKHAKKLHDITDEIAETNVEVYGDKNRNDTEIKSIKKTEKLKLNIDSIINDRTTKNSSVSFCQNLNQVAGMGKIDKVIGRDDEINQIERVLARRVCNNVILVGKSGCGKTAIVKGLALMINSQTGPISLLKKTIFMLDGMHLVSGTTLRGMIQERMVKMFRELSSVNGSVLFIDDVHILDASGEDVKIIPQLLSMINNNNIPVILSTTEDGYRTVTNVSADVKRRFQRINVQEMNDCMNMSVIEGILPTYEDFHHVTYDIKAVDMCVELAKRYISERSLPSSAIDVLDEAGALKKLEVTQPEELKTLLKDVSSVKEKIKEAVRKDNIEERDRLYDELDALKVKANDILETNANGIVTEQDIYNAVSTHTGIPVSKLSVSEKKQLANIENVMKSKIIGQENAIHSIANAIKRNKVGLYKRSKPIYCAFFDGVTGVGKTLTAKVLAEEIFGDEKYLVRFDMSEYSDKTAVNKLIGTGAGYIGYDNGGLLTEAIKNKKNAVLLFDEIEKADDSIYNVMLQILEEATLTDNMGNKVDFRNTIVIFTSNVGAKNAVSDKPIGFGEYDTINETDRTREILEKELKKEFPPEFLNRLDDIVYFNRLTNDNLKDVIRLELDKCKKRVCDAGYNISFDDTTVDFILEDIKNDKDYGARPILRSIERNIEDEVSDTIIEEDDVKSFKVFVEDEKLVVEFSKEAKN